MGSLFPGLKGRRMWRSISLVVVCSLVVVISMVVPWLTLPALALALVGLAYEWLRTEHTISKLAEKLSEDIETAKIEVREGRWAHLQYALNRILQQRRAQQHLQALLPSWPSGAADVLAAHIPPEGVPRQIVVLALSLPTPSIETWRQLSALITRLAEEQTIFVDWNGSVMLMAFGAFADHERNYLLRAALQTARQIDKLFAASALTMAIAAGESRITVLPGLGYSLMGAALQQATLLSVSAHSLRNHRVLLCSEELYLTLRHLGNAPAIPTGLNLGNTLPAVYAIALA
jgi:hypothetical protein